MLITREDYYRKGHIYLESREGRENIWGLFRESIEENLKPGGVLGNAVANIKVLQGYIQGDSFIFMNYDIPNVFSLKGKKGDIKEDALGFLKEITDSGLITRLYMKVNKADHKFDLLFMMAKYFPDIKALRLKHYTDLCLMTFHTLLFLDGFEGTDKDHFDLGDLCMRVLVKYDCAKTAVRFIRDARLPEALKAATGKTPSEQYVALLRDAVRKMAISGAFDEECFAALTLTDMLFYVLDEEHDRLVSGLFVENKERIKSFLAARLNELLAGKEEEKRAVLNVLLGLLDERAFGKKEQSPTQSPSELLYQAQQTER